MTQKTLVERLRATKKGAIFEVARNPDGLEAVDTILNLEAENERLKAALGWYRIQAEGCRKLGQHGEIYRNALDRDGGQCARTALGDK